MRTVVVWTSFPEKKIISIRALLFLPEARTLALKEGLQVPCNPSFSAPDEENRLSCYHCLLLDLKGRWKV